MVQPTRFRIRIVHASFEFMIIPARGWMNYVRRDIVSVMLFTAAVRGFGMIILDNEPQRIFVLKVGTPIKEDHTSYVSYGNICSV